MSDHATILALAQERIRSCESLDALRDVEREHVGKGGVVAELLSQIPSLPSEARPAAGREANQLKQSILQSVEARRLELSEAQISAERSGEGFDAICFASGRTARHFLESMFEAHGEARARAHLAAAKVIAIGPVTADALDALDIRVDAVATARDDAAMVAAVISSLSGPDQA